jgi:hypothetical protein
MRPHRIEDFARQFPDNGMKLLLQGPLNVRDALRIARYPNVNAIDYEHLKVDPTTYVQRDYRHVESDVVLHGPLRRKQNLFIYILIGHQSEPDLLMPFRALDYTMPIHRSQMRKWGQAHPSYKGFAFQPVLPVVFYTGTRRWRGVGQMADLIAGGADLAGLAPTLQPLFLPLRDTPDAQLVSDGGFFGQVLRLVKQRNARGPAFRTLLGQVVGELEKMPDAERLRWLDLLSYIHALVYHERAPAERESLNTHIARSVKTDPHRQEVNTMKKSIADVLKEEGRNEERLVSRRTTLLRLIRRQFGEPPANVIAAIEACADVAQLDTWTDKILSARKLADLGLEPRD